MYVRVIDAAGSLLAPPTSQRLKSGYVVLQSGEAVGEHVTDGREEMIIILEGAARVECEGESVELEARSTVYIPKDSHHNVMNRGQNELKYIYVVTRVD
jgi:mannose-6-phosphate isomerase-like protein (cupin superfamily)